MATAGAVCARGAGRGLTLQPGSGAAHHVDVQVVHFLAPFGTRIGEDAEAALGVGTAAFLQRQPGFAPLREDLQRFLRMSSEQFFGGAAREADDGRWLLALARKCRDAERGLA